jgi:hypothetical protein
MTKMSHSNDTHTAPVQPSLSQLLADYLQRQAEAHAAGLAAADAGGEVVPFEAGPVQPVDARLAWDEAVAPVRYLAARSETRTWQAPPHWPNLVSGHEPVASLAFALGNFPQLVRNLLPLLQAAGLSELRPAPGRPTPAPALLDWASEAVARRKFPQTLLAIGALRLAKQFAKADEVIGAADANVPAEWRAAWDNEKAALAWHRGDCEKAHALWLAQPESVPVLFNRGMSALFLDRYAQARAALKAVVGQVPETSAWHHLAQLYLTLAETRGA